jgi:hypothetical protein
MANPVMLMQILMIVNANRCFRQSDIVAKNMLQPKAAAHGGIE